MSIYSEPLSEIAKRVLREGDTLEWLTAVDEVVEASVRSVEEKVKKKVREKARRSNPWREMSIRDRKQQVMRQLRGSRIYGEPVDLDNPDEVIVAAYLLGRAEEMGL